MAPGLHDYVHGHASTQPPAPRLNRTTSAPGVRDDENNDLRGAHYWAEKAAAQFEKLTTNNNSGRPEDVPDFEDNGDAEIAEFETSYSKEQDMFGTSYQSTEMSDSKSPFNQAAQMMVAKAGLKSVDLHRDDSRAVDHAAGHQSVQQGQGEGTGHHSVPRHLVEGRGPIFNAVPDLRPIAAQGRERHATVKDHHEQRQRAQREGTLDVTDTASSGFGITHDDTGPRSDVPDSRPGSVHRFEQPQETGCLASNQQVTSDSSARADQAYFQHQHQQDNVKNYQAGVHTKQVKQQQQLSDVDRKNMSKPKPKKSRRSTKMAEPAMILPSHAAPEATNQHMQSLQPTTANTVGFNEKHDMTPDQCERTRSTPQPHGHIEDMSTKDRVNQEAHFLDHRRVLVSTHKPGTFDKDCSTMAVPRQPCGDETYLVHPQGKLQIAQDVPIESHNHLGPHHDPIRVKTNNRASQPDVNHSGRIYINDNAEALSNQENEPTDHAALDIRNKKRAHVDISLDYELQDLIKMPFDQLHEESFEVDPGHASHTSPAELEDLHLTEKMKLLAERQDYDRQAYLAALTMKEWEEAGGWILTRFSRVTKHLSQSRQNRRMLARKFEDEIARRHNELREDDSQIQIELDHMKASGQRVIEQTPKRKH